MSSPHFLSYPEGMYLCLLTPGLWENIGESQSPLARPLLRMQPRRQPSSAKL